MPYAYLDENGEYDGYDVAVVKAIDEKLLDYTFTFEGADFPTTLSNLESNKVQMAAYEYEVNDERKENSSMGMGYGSGIRILSLIQMPVRSTIASKI